MQTLRRSGEHRRLPPVPLSFSLPGTPAVTVAEEGQVIPLDPVPTPPPAPPSRYRVLKFVAVIGVFALLFVFIDPREVLLILRRMPLKVVALAVLVLSVDRFMMGLKWRHLVLSAGESMRLSDAVSIYYQSKFATLIFPAAFGGEVLRGVLGTRAGVPGPTLVASMVVERVVAAVSSLLLAVIGLSYLSQLPSYGRYADTVTLLVVSATLALGLSALLALHRPSHKLMGRALRRWVPGRIMQLLNRLSMAAVRYKRAPGVLLINLLLTLVEHVLQMAALYVLSLGLNLHLSALHFFAATSIIMLVRRGAGFLEGWGIAESGVIMLYTLFGVGASRSAALALALWAVSLLACLPGGYLLWRGAWRTVSPQRSNVAEM